MALLDLLGRRWALRVLWELRDAPLGFNELQERCGAVSPSVLSQRLRELRASGVVELDEAGRYRVSGPGRELGESLLALDRWARRWLGPARAAPASSRRGRARARRRTDSG